MLATITAEREEQEDRLQQRHVRAAERLVGQQAEARPGEDRLDRDGPRDDEADVEEDQRDGRQQRVGHGVPAAHEVVPQPLGPGRREVVLAELVEQRGAHDQRVLREVGQGQGRGRAGTGATATSRMPSSDLLGVRASTMPAAREQPREGPMPVLNRISSIMPSQNSGIAYSVSVHPGRRPVEPAVAPPAALDADPQTRSTVDSTVDGAEQQHRSARPSRRSRPTPAGENCVEMPRSPENGFFT